MVGTSTSLDALKLEKGGLAVVETSDGSVGNVIKRLFRNETGLILVSVNPVSPHDPIPVAKANVGRIWPVRGVLFEVSAVE